MRLSPIEQSNALTPAEIAKAEMARLGMDKYALAKATGLAPCSIKNHLGGNQRSLKGERKIEAALRIPIWSTPEIFSARLPMIKHFGCDLETLSAIELQALWRRVTNKRQVRRNRALLLSLLMEHFTAAKAAQTQKDV